MKIIQYLAKLWTMVFLRLTVYKDEVVLAKEHTDRVWQIECHKGKV